VLRDNPGPERQSNWLPTPAGPFYAIIRVYAPAAEVAAGLKNPATFQAPPAIVPMA
jgi:hypothetical protein